MANPTRPQGQPTTTTTTDKKKKKNTYQPNTNKTGNWASTGSSSNPYGQSSKD